MIDGIKSDVAEFRGLDVNNSSTELLAAGATSAGSWQINGDDGLDISYQASHDASILIDFSNDGGANFTTITRKVLAGSHFYDSIKKGGRFHRVRDQNTGAATQTYKRMYVYTGAYDQLNSPINSQIQLSAGARITRPIDFNLLLANIPGFRLRHRLHKLSLLALILAPSGIHTWPARHRLITRLPARQSLDLVHIRLGMTFTDAILRILMAVQAHHSMLAILRFNRLQAQEQTCFCV